MSQEIYIIPQNIENFTFKYFFENIKDVEEFYIYGKISQYDSLLKLSSINVHFKDGGDCYIMQNDKFNLSHQGENKSLEGLDEIKDDMNDFLNKRDKLCKLDPQTNQCKKI